MPSPKKIGFDDYMLTHTLEEFMNLPRIDPETDPAFEEVRNSYDEWVERKEAEQTTPNIGQVRLTDLGNGERFAIREKDNVHFSEDAGWRYFDGKYWKRDTISEIGRRAATCVRKIYIEAAQTKDQ